MEFDYLKTVVPRADVQRTLLSYLLIVLRGSHIDIYEDFRLSVFCTRSQKPAGGFVTFKYSEFKVG